MMVYWTPLDLEQVFNGWEEMAANTVELEVSGVTLQVMPIGDGKAEIIRLISADPMDYLNRELAPGRIVSMV